MASLGESHIKICLNFAKLDIPRLIKVKLFQHGYLETASWNAKKFSRKIYSFDIFFFLRVMCPEGISHLKDQIF